MSYNTVSNAKTGQAGHHLVVREHLFSQAVLSASLPNRATWICIRKIAAKVWEAPCRSFRSRMEVSRWQRPPRHQLPSLHTSPHLHPPATFPVHPFSPQHCAHWCWPLFFCIHGWRDGAGFAAGIAYSPGIEKHFTVILQHLVLVKQLLHWCSLMLGLGCDQL